VALELQLSTQKAQEAIRQITVSLNTLSDTFAKFGSGKNNLNKALEGVQNFKGLPGGAVDSLVKLADVLGRLKNAGNLNELSRGLNALARVKVDSVAQNVERINKALAGMRIPPGVAALAITLRNIGSAAQTASGNVRNLASALNNVRAGQTWSTLGQSLQNLGRGAANARGAMLNLGGAFSTANNFAAAFGVTLGGLGLARFIQGSYDAASAVQQFKALMGSLSQEAGFADKELAFVRKTTTELAIAVEPALKAYSKLSAAMIGAGKKTEDVHKIFTSLSTVFRVLASTPDQIARGFLAVEQMYSKGAVSMEELRRQLGEIFPAFNLLAEGMNITTAELSKLIQTGKVDPEMLSKLADAAIERYGKGLPDALQTAQASMTLLGNAMFWLQESFGEGFLTAIQPAINNLTKTLAGDDVIDAAKQWGYLAGQIGGALVDAINWAVRNWDTLVLAMQSLFALKVADWVARLILSWSGFGSIISWFVPGLAAMTKGLGGFGAVATGITNSGVLTNLAAGFRLVGAAMGFLLGNYIVAALTGIAIGIAALVTYTDSWGDAWEYVKQAFWDTVAAATSWGSTAASVISSIASRVSDFNNNYLVPLYDMIVSIPETFRSWVDAAYEAVTSVASWIGGRLTEAISTAYNAVTRLPSAFAEWLSGTIKGAINSVLGWVDNVIKKVGALLTMLAKAIGITGGSEISVDTTGAGAYAGGGIAGSGKMHRVPSALFVNAPKLASGIENTNILAGGGIPAILHPNEAVVPLTGGGQIPVQQLGNGGGAESGSAVVARYIRNLTYITTEMKTDIGRLRETATNGFALTHTDLQNILEILQAQTEKIYLGIFDLQKRLSVSGGSGGGSYGGSVGGGAYGGVGVGGIGTANADGTITYPSYYAYQQALRKEAEDKYGKYSNMASTVGYGGKIPKDIYAPYTVKPNTSLGAGTPYGFIDGSWGAGYANTSTGSETMFGGFENWGFNLSDMIDNSAPEVSRGILDANYDWSAAGYWGSPSPYIQSYPTTLGSNAIFADGSPNAYRDTQGGFNAILHPNEAVIPLPDGRSVPVHFPDDPLERVRDYIDRFSSDGNTARVGDTEGRERGNGGVTVIVNMTVNATDAGSFKKSQSQLMQELHANMQKAVRDVGTIRKGADDIVTVRRGS
jgi:tape measure domain-containing protein